MNMYEHLTRPACVTLVTFLTGYLIAVPAGHPLAALVVMFCALVVNFDLMRYVSTDGDAVPDELFAVSVGCAMVVTLSSLMLWG